MNKTKLKIIRINEDVIATSFVVKGNYQGCIRLAEYDSGNDRWGIDTAESENKAFQDAGSVSTDFIQSKYKNAYGVNPSSLNKNDLFCVYYDGTNYYYYKHDDLGSDHSHN